MPTVEERYAAATAYVRRAVAAVEDRAISYAVDPITGLVEWYAGRTKTEPARNELARIEERWLRTTNDIDRARVARDAELLADRVQESLPGAPQNRQRTNLWHGELQQATPATSYDGEVVSQAGEYWDWANGKGESLSDEAKSLGKWLLIGGGVVLGWKLVDLLRKRQHTVEARSAGATRQALNAALTRVAARRDARPKRHRVRNAGRKAWDYDAVTYDGGIYCVDCLPEGVSVDDEDVTPIFTVDELQYAPVCDRCGAVHDYMNVLEPGPVRDAGGRRQRPHTYSVQLKRGEIEALHFLRGRYASARAFRDGLNPLDDDADRALSREFVRGQGPYRFQIRASDVRRALRATVGDGGDYGTIPNLRSDAIDWVLAEEWRRAP
jgi:hypothetical protein